MKTARPIQKLIIASCGIMEPYRKIERANGATVRRETHSDIPIPRSEPQTLT